MTPRVGEVRERVLPRFHPETVIRELGDGEAIKISDLVTHTAVLGATGSGKSSGSGRFLLMGCLGSAAEAGMLFLCPKPSDPAEYMRLCELTGRSKDVRLFDATGEHYRFNFLDWLAGHASEGAGLTSNVVAFLEEIITALEPEKSGSGGGDNVFWEDSLHQLLVAAVDLVQLAGYELSIPTMRDIVRSAPLSREQAKDPTWQAESACWFFLERARERCASLDDDTQADYAECRAYFTDDLANLSEKTRSVITLMFSKLAQHFTARPLRKLFCTDTTCTPEDTFSGACIIVALPTQEFRTVGRIAALTWKAAWQLAVLRRKPAPEGEYLRPVCCVADEAADNFLSRGDLVFAAAARSSAGALIYLTQNISQYRKRLGSEDAFEGFISNLQTIFVHQSTGPTCRWMSERLGEAWVKVASVNTGQSSVGTSGRSLTAAPTSTSGASISEQRRFLLEPAALTTLKRGGPACGFEVEAILFKGGALFKDGLPFKRILFSQR